MIIIAKKVKGICHICGRETDLTFEHIPPKSALNWYNLKLYDLCNYIFNNESKYKQLQQGAGRHSLCASCNNNTGKWYGAAYAEFALQGRRYYLMQSQGLIDLPFTIYPLRVLKQIISCFASVNDSSWCQQKPAIKRFLLDPYERRFPPEIDIRMYLQDSERIKLSGIHGYMNTFTGERIIGSEWGYPPFSFINVCDKSYTNYYILNELYPVLRFLQYGYNDRVTLYLRIPRKPCNPVMLDFRKNVPDIGTLIQLKHDEHNSIKKEKTNI